MNRDRTLPASRAARGGFTLIELLMASIAYMIILAAIYGVFSRAVKMRDQATARSHDARLRARAESVIRNDLRNALVTGVSENLLARMLRGSRDGTESRFPGYLKFTTTTGKDTPDHLRGDVQAVEYFIADDPESENRDSGVLVRTVNRDLLAETEETPPEDLLLTGVAAFEVEFFDGDSWVDTWDIGEEETGTEEEAAELVLPKAIRVRILEAPTERRPAPAPIEILVPWTTQPATAPATATTTPPS